MIFPHFDAYAFSKLTQRQRMLQQLQGRGYGQFGIANVIHTNGGRVTALAATTQLGFTRESAGVALMQQGSTPDPAVLAPLPQAPADPCAGVMCPAGHICRDGVCYEQRSGVALEPFQQQDPCTGVICPADQSCSGGVCTPNRAVVDTTYQDKVIDSTPISTMTQPVQPQTSTPYVDPGGRVSPREVAYQPAPDFTPTVPEAAPIDAPLFQKPGLRTMAPARETGDQSLVRPRGYVPTYSPPYAPTYVPVDSGGASYPTGSSYDGGGYYNAGSGGGYADSYAPPAYDPGYGGGGGGGGSGGSVATPKAPTPAQQAQNILAQPVGSSMPWWGWALGAAAVGYGIYKMGGRR